MVTNKYHIGNTDIGDPRRGIKEEPLFSDDNMENKTKPVDVKRTAGQDAGHAVNEENGKCNSNGISSYIAS